MTMHKAIDKVGLAGFLLYIDVWKIPLNMNDLVKCSHNEKWKSLFVQG